MKPQDLYHIGIVVDDLDTTLRWFTDTAGYRWCEEYAGDQLVETPAGEVTIPMRFAYSMDEPRLEILQSVPGTLWTSTDSGIHHLGYWSDDVNADVAVLVAGGHELEAIVRLDEDTSMWAYCRGEGGTRIEFVHSMMRPIMNQWFETGRMPGSEDIDLPFDAPQT